MCNAWVTLVHCRCCRRRRRHRWTASLTQIPNRLFFPPACSRFFISAPWCVRAFFFPSPPGTQRSLVCSLSSPHAPIFFCLSRPPLPRILSQILTYDYVRANVGVSTVGPFERMAISLRWRIICNVIMNFLLDSVSLYKKFSSISVFLYIKNLKVLKMLKKL